MTLVPRKYGRLKTTSYSSPWKQDRSSGDVLCVVLLPRQSRWRISSTLASTTTKPVYLSIFAPLILLIVIIVRLTSATKHHYNPPVGIDLSNPWIPIDFLSNHTFNADVDGCSANSWSDCGRGGKIDKQCLLPDWEFRYLDRAEDRRRFCDMKSWKRRQELAVIRLRHCPYYTLYTVLSNRSAHLVVNGTRSQCVSVLEELSLLDGKVHTIACEFDHVLKRYDCHRQYSAQWSCKHCQVTLFFSRPIPQPICFFLLLLQMHCLCLHNLLNWYPSIVAIATDIEGLSIANVHHFTTGRSSFVPVYGELSNKSN